MLLCNLRARPTTPFVGDISRDSKQIGGGLMMRTGALEGTATPHRPDANQCARPPFASQQLPAQSDRLTAAARPLLPLRPGQDCMTPDRRRNTPEIGEVPGAARDFRPRSLAPRLRGSMAVDFQSRTGLDRPGTGTPWGDSNVGSLWRLPAPVLYGWVRFAVPPQGN